MRIFILVNFSETTCHSFKSGCPEHIQGFSEILNDWMFHHDHSLSLVFKNVYGNIIFCHFHLNLSNFLIVCHESTSQENVMGFKIKI